MSEQAAPRAAVRRLGREYGWLLAAVGLAALVLLCSVPFVTGVGMSWNSGDPFAAPQQVPPPPASTTAAAPAKPQKSPTPSPSKATTQRRPATPRTSGPTPRRTTPPPPAAAPRAAIALGPDGGGMGLWQMLREYCADTYRTWEAQLRHGTGRAEDNWECRRRGDNPLIDMNAACRRVYGSAAFAQYSNRGDAVSWRCYRR